MLHLRHPFVLAALIGTALAPSLATASCGAAFCSVNTSSAFMDGGLSGNTRLDLRFEFIDQNQPRQESHNVRVGEISQHHDEVRTINRNWLASIEHDLARNWTVGLTLPIIDRSHAHIHNHHHHGEVLHIPEEWDFTEIGDLRINARHEFVAEHKQSFGLSIGVKLPTGKTDVENSEGDLAERTLQPGSGTTDLLLGAHWRRELDSGSTVFASVSAQISGPEHDGFRPGHRYHLDLGWRAALGERLTLPVQLNLAVKERDQGTEAEPDESGATTVALSPGLIYSLAPNWRVYGYYQRPLHQKVNGVQLTAHWSAVLGTTFAF